jgi:hypothetical protein
MMDRSNVWARVSSWENESVTTWPNGSEIYTLTELRAAVKGAAGGNCAVRHFASTPDTAGVIVLKCLEHSFQRLAALYCRVVEPVSGGQK